MAVRNAGVSDIPGAETWSENAVRPGAEGDKLGSVFSDAGPDMKLLVAALLLAAVAALALEIYNNVRSDRRSERALRGMGFLSAMRLGGLLLGLVGAVRLLMALCVRIVFDGGVPPFVVLAPAFAEALLMLLAGLIASTAAVFAHANGVALERRRTARAAAA